MKKRVLISATMIFVFLFFGSAFAMGTPTMQAALDSSGEKVVLAWNQVPGARYYKIERQKINGDSAVFDKLIDADSNDEHGDNIEANHTVIDDTVQPGTSYCYRLQVSMDNKNWIKSQVFTGWIKVPVQLQSLHVSVSEVSVNADDSIPITPAVGAGIIIAGQYSDGSTKPLTSDISYAIEDNTIASFPGNGTIIGLEPGTTNLNITYQGKTARIKVVVLISKKDAYNAAITQLDVENNTKYLPSPDGTTYCNVYAEDLMNLLGVPLPGYPANYELAEDILSWMESSDGHAAGWRKVNQGVAQTQANHGYPTLALTSDHIVAVCPQRQGDTGIVISQAGYKNYQYASIANAWPASVLPTVCYYTHDVDIA